MTALSQIGFHEVTFRGRPKGPLVYSPAHREQRATGSAAFHTILTLAAVSTRLANSKNSLSPTTVTRREIMMTASSTSPLPAHPGKSPLYSD